MDRMLSMHQLVAITGLSRSTIWRLQKDGKFIGGVKLSANRVGYSESALKEWVESRPPVEAQGARNESI